MMIPNRTIHVTVGRFETSLKGVPLQTTLGSCVSVILYFHTPSLVSSMSHYLLDRKPENLSIHHPEAMRYGDVLLDAQLMSMSGYGSLGDLRAMIFGGARSYNQYHSELISEIGRHNVEIAKEILTNKKIPITAEDTGGNEARHLEFYPDRKKAKEWLITEDVTRLFP